MILSSDIYGLIEFFSFLIWIFYGLNILCLIILKKRRYSSIRNTLDLNTKKVDPSEKEHHLEVSRLKINIKFNIFEIKLFTFKASLHSPYNNASYNRRLSSCVTVFS